MKSLICLLFICSTSYAASPTELDKANAAVAIHMEMLKLEKPVKSGTCTCEDCKCVDKDKCPLGCPANEVKVEAAPIQQYTAQYKWYRGTGWVIEYTPVTTYTQPTYQFTNSCSSCSNCQNGNCRIK